MSRAVSAGAGAALAAALLLLPAPLGRPAAVLGDDYPLAAGLKWTYRAVGGLTVVREVRGVRSLGGLDHYEMAFQLPLLGIRILPMRRTTEGVVTRREGRDHLLMRFPMEPADRWRIDLPGEPEIVDCEVVGSEEVEYLGGRGMATKLRVVRRDRGSRRAVTDHEWYVRGIGLVRMEVTAGIRATFTLEGFAR